VLVVGGLGQHLEEVRVAGHTAIVLGRTGRPARPRGRSRPRRGQPDRHPSRPQASGAGSTTAPSSDWSQVSTASRWSRESPKTSSEIPWRAEVNAPATFRVDLATSSMSRSGSAGPSRTPPMSKLCECALMLLSLSSREETPGLRRVFTVIGEPGYVAPGERGVVREAAFERRDASQPGIERAGDRLEADASRHACCPRSGPAGTVSGLTR